MLKYLAILISFSSFAQQSTVQNQLLWEISGNGLKANSYLFGSLHSNDRRIFNLTDSAYIALDNASMIVLETDVFSMFGELDTREGQAKLKFDNDGNPYVNSIKASSSIYGDEDGMPQFLDAYFQQYCYNANKKFTPLETVDYQLNLFSEVKTLDYHSVNLQAILSSKDELVELYLKGDIYDLDEYLKMSLALYKNGYNRLIVDRNESMSLKIDSCLKIQNNTIFCAIGAGHLAGEKGLINILQQKGYKMRLVSTNYSDKLKEKTVVKSHHSYHYTNDSLGLNIVFPGRPERITSTDEEFDFELIYQDFGQGNTYEVEVYLMTEELGLETLAKKYIASPVESKIEKVILDNGGEAFEGLSDAYPEGYYWTRVMLGEEYFIVIKAYGGNKFMNSKRAQHFFQKVWFD